MAVLNRMPFKSQAQRRKFAELLVQGKISPETFVYTGSALKIEPNTEDHSVSFHFDGEAASNEHWPD